MEVGGCRGDLTAREDGQVRIVMMRKNIYVYRIKKKISGTDGLPIRRLHHVQWAGKYTTRLGGAYGRKKNYLTVGSHLQTATHYSSIFITQAQQK